MNVQDLEDLSEGEGDIDEGDFGIIITADGKLKMLLMPDDIDQSDQVPDVIAQIISLFKHSNIDHSNRVLH